MVRVYDVLIPFWNFPMFHSMYLIRDSSFAKTQWKILEITMLIKSARGALKSINYEKRR